MSKARTLADLVSTGGELADGQISVSEISDLTASAAELNTLDGITATVTELNTLDGITATVTELNYMDGATSSIQNQLDNISVTSGTLTKTFANGETASITLSSAISPAPVVSVTKEVAQTGITSKGSWDVATDGANYELHDTAYATTLTPGSILNSLDEWVDSTKSFSFSSEEATPEVIAFNNDGTKMYIAGQSGDDVNQYTLSTAWDVSTASFDSVTFSFGDNISGLLFNNNGTKMYIMAFNGSISQYSLSTAYNVSTASSDSVSFDPTSQAPGARDMQFNNDGTKMYLVCLSTNAVYEYVLSTAYDLSSMSYNSVSFSIAGQDTLASGIAFNSSGTKMFLAGDTGNTLDQYSLSTAFDLSTASYDSVTLDINSYDATIRDVILGNNDTNAYIIGTTNKTVYQFNTSKDALLLGSGSFASTDVGKRIVGNGGEAILTATDGSYSLVTAFDDSSTIASGSWSMYALTFDGTDGVKIGGIVNGFDLANASYDSVSFNIAGTESIPHGITFNNDGTKMYVTGNGGDDVNQYILSAPFDVSTAVFDSPSFSVSLEEATPQDVKFNNDGTKMYIVGSNDDEVNQYVLSTPFEISTASLETTFSVSSEEILPTGMAFNNDGTKMYIVGTTGDDVNQYTLSEAFNVATASFDSITFSVASQTSEPKQIAFNNDGTKMYILSSSNDSVFEYTLSTGFDISTASYDSVSFNVGSEESEPEGLAFNSDGTKMYIVGTVSDTVFQYSTGSLFTPTSQYHPTVTKTGGQIDTAFWTDINTMTADETLNGGEVYYAVSTDNRTTWAVIDNTDGVRPIVRNNAGTWEYNDASTYGGTTWVNATTNDELYALQEALEDGNAEEVIGFDLSSASYDSVSFSVASQETTPSDLAFNDDGTKMYIIGYNTDSIYQYSLSTAFDVSTASYDSVSFSVSSQETAPMGLAFNTDGTKMFVVGQTGNDVNEYALSTGFDISTAAFTTNFSLTGVASSDAEGITFKPDGTKMYIVGSTDKVWQFSLSTGFDISTASYDSVSLTITSEETVARGLTISNDGTKLFVVGQTGDDVNLYTLSTAFDLSTASFTTTFSVASEDLTPHDIVFNNDGTKMYIIGQSNDSVFQYTTSTTNNFNRMNSTQLNAVTDPNHYTLGDTLDLAIMLYTDSAGSIPESDGVSINYDAEALNQGAVLGTDYDFDFPDSTTVRVTSNAAQNLKIRVV